MDQSDSSDKQRWVFLFGLWLCLRTLIWLAAVILTQPNAPLDLIEWSSWSHVIALGYPKHPPFPAWVASAFAWLSPGDVWGIYLAGYLFTAVTLFASWKLACEFLPPRHSLLAVICLDGLIFMTGDPSEFSNNVVLNTAWSLTVLFFVYAIRGGKIRWWLAMGAVVGLGLLSKYTLGLLVVILAGYVLFDKKTRLIIKTPGPYLAAIVALILFAPHAYWLIQNDFSPLRYASDRSASPYGLISHLRHPAGFILDQFFIIAPVLLVLATAVGNRSTNFQICEDHKLLDWVVMGPVVVLLTLSFTTGCQLRDIWGSPLWIFLGTWTLVKWGSISNNHLRLSTYTWAMVALGMFSFCMGRNLFLPYLTQRPTRIHFPGKLLAQEINQRWAYHCNKPFEIVAGEAWRAGNVSVYSTQRPLLYSSGSMGYFLFDPQFSPWTSDQDFSIRGGVIVWDANEIGDELTPEVLLRFPQAVVQAPISLPFLTGAKVRPERTGLAFIFPKSP